MPQQEKPKKKTSVRDSIPLSTSPIASWGSGAIIAPAIGLRPKPTAVKGSGKGKEMSRSKKALEMYKKRKGLK